MANPLRSSAGFTYIAALVLVIIMGIMLGAAGQSWKMIAAREREEEFMFRAGQIRDAMIRWYKPRPGQHVVTPLRDIKDLLKDPRSLANVRYLRRLYTDPITGKEFEVVKGAGGGIIGVVSPSEGKPLKMANFPPELKHFEDKKTYKEWLFVPGKLRATLVPPVGTVPAAGGQQPTIIQGGTGQPK